jgi:myo-inositol-1(or 4)-monophosphatase
VLDTSSQLEKYLDIASEAALAAGTIILDNWGKIETIEEKGRSGDLVTEIDRRAETEILKIIGRHFPKHGFLAEESGKLPGTDSDYLWAIDPLDGTTNYAHGYPVSVVSIGLLIAGIAAVGVIYNPFRKELFRAAQGLGATLNRRPIHVSRTSELEKSLLVTGFAYDRCQTSDNNYAEFCYLTHLTQGVRRSGSAANDLTDVACGRLDGYWERGINPWDLAAGVILIEEAGGKISAYDESPFLIETGRILATNGQIHTPLSQALQKAASWSFQF